MYCKRKELEARDQHLVPLFSTLFLRRQFSLDWELDNQLSSLILGFRNLFFSLTTHAAMYWDCGHELHEPTF